MTVAVTSFGCRLNGVETARAARLRALGERALRRRLGVQAGRVLPVFVERGGRGRTPNVTAVRLDPTLEAGSEGDDGRKLHGWPVNKIRQGEGRRGIG